MSAESEIQKRCALAIETIADRQIGADMSFRICCAEFMELSPKGQIKICRDMAAEARRLAATRTVEGREQYEELTRQWSNLAEEVEKVWEIGTAVQVVNEAAPAASHKAQARIPERTR